MKIMPQVVMNKRILNLTLLAFISKSIVAQKCKNIKPHIIFIMADDVGWNDVSMHGSAQIPTPNIDALAYNGQNLHRHYTMHICTPSRTALLTSYYPFRLGMQGIALKPAEKRLIDPKLKFLPAWLKDLGYKTHLVGKWHMGHYDKSITPNERGFDSALCYYNGLIGYYDYSIEGLKGQVGYDLHRNNLPEWKARGKYATEYFTNEAVNIIQKHNSCDPLFLMVTHLAGHKGSNGLEAKNNTYANLKFNYIEEPQRRLYAGIITELDKSVGKLMKALTKKNMLKDSIVVFISDNGGQTTDPIFGYANYASNWPQKGMKWTLSEGGVRNIGAIWSPKLCRKNFVNKVPMHIVDWLPTLYAAAEGNISNLKDIDGKNQWQSFTNCSTQEVKRDPIVINIDEKQKYKAILSGDGKFKLIIGTFKFGVYDIYTGDSGRGPNDPPYDTQSVLNSDTNEAIISTGTQTPLTAQIVNRMRRETLIKECPGKRLNLCRKICLYNLEDDPTEKHDVKQKYLDIFINLLGKLNEEKLRLKPSLNRKPDPRGSPKRCNNAWFTWEEPKANNPECSSKYKTL